MRAVLRRYRLLAAFFLIAIIIVLFQPAAGREIYLSSMVFIKKMLICMPPIFVLLNLIDVWLPKDLISRYLGGRNGSLGILLTMALGFTASGPHYGAFPIAVTLMNKGATFRNAMVFLGSWSILKVSMVLYEISILGPKFGLTRLLINVPGVILIAVLVDLFIPEEEKKRICTRSVYKSR